MDKFLHKHRHWIISVVALLAIAAMVMYVLSDDEAIQPGPVNPDTTKMPAAP
jgi:hypothetical protein